jgi:hypothetical protein
VLHDFLPQVFHEPFFPKSLKTTLESFQIFLKICGDICKSRCTSGISNTNTDTSAKIATSINDTVSEFIDDVNNTTGK